MVTCGHDLLQMVISLASKELSAYSNSGAIAEVLSSIQTVIAFGVQKEIQRSVPLVTTEYASFYFLKRS
jgi:hypothetical protein